MIQIGISTHSIMRIKQNHFPKHIPIVREIMQNCFGNAARCAKHQKIGLFHNVKGVLCSIKMFGWAWRENCRPKTALNQRKKRRPLS